MVSFHRIQRKGAPRNMTKILNQGVCLTKSGKDTRISDVITAEYLLNVFSLLSTTLRDFRNKF